ncbi:MAG: hypothetical protein JJU34_07445 [Lunatimonas sp.]|uniref:DUF6786 family protein n=1 Tax=Lunatimonas sp. TaxID=2060141 RepID=UPI00263BD09E|nr:DUF6786 family protein [Lunatimonas sp.]MCC5937099.1 hypothetical protein [Lunatimonas sp.]
MNSARILFFSIVFLCFCSCQKGEIQGEEIQPYAEGSFGYDVDFLAGVDESFIVLADGGSQILLSPRFQGKVFTSTAKGLSGTSYGWMNYDAIGSGIIAPHINAYGGEDRLWLGPEGGPFSIYFPPGSEMVFDNWQTPASIDSEAWELTESTERSAAMVKTLLLKNYSGTTFEAKLDRTVGLVDAESMEMDLSVSVPASVSWVGFESVNGLTNIGETSWGQENGTLCLWVLGMFNPSDKLMVLVPYVEGAVDELGEIATTDYFGEIPEERIQAVDGLLVFRGDGRYRSKLGLSPKRAKSLLGSFDVDSNVLTVVTYNKPSGELPYLNQVWGPQDFPYAGDAINSYNDGPLEDGTQMGPFYELETVSPAAFLSPGERLEHIHRTYHFEGSEEQMSELLGEIFGITLEVLKEKL